MTRAPIRVAFIASHPIQYVAPLYRRLSERDDLAVKVFFTWHAGAEPVEDRGFRMRIAWDIPLNDGYEFERVPNISLDPGTHRFVGLVNPSLVRRVAAWRPDVVHVSGWAWLSHLAAMRRLSRRGVAVLFRGDSHLLDDARAGPRWRMKRALLRRVFAWPTGVLAAGAANRDYFEKFGIAPPRIFPCPHSIDVARFAEPAAVLEAEAARWRRELGIAAGQKVALFAGKFEPKKRPLDLMRAVRFLAKPDVVVVLVGGGELQSEIDAFAAADPARFRVLPFQNQSRMPVVYRTGDLFVLPSAYHESWGLAVNEALACGRPVLVSDRVGCAADLVDQTCGGIFPAGDVAALAGAIDQLIGKADEPAMRAAAMRRAWQFDIAATESALVAAVGQVCAR